MKRAIIFGLVLIACTILLSKNSAGADDEERLLKDISRSDRFKLVVREAAKELGLDLGALGADIVRRFSFPADVEQDSIFGIDLSHHNEDGCRCTINWDHAVGQKVSFAYLKATQGSTSQDARFGKNWTALEKTQIFRGAYHFLSPFSSPEDQVKNLLKTMGTLRPNDLPPVMDIEWTDPANPDNDGWKTMSPDEIVVFALKWLRGVEEATGRIPLIYTSRAWWKDRVTDANLAKFQRYPIWIAQYVPGSTKGQQLPNNLPAQWAWKIWQFTDSGGISGGLSGQLDVSVFKGSLDQFQQTFGISLPTPMPTPIDTPTTDVNLTPGGGASPSGNTPPAASTPAAAPASGTGTPTATSTTGANPGPTTGASPPTGPASASGATPAPKPKSGGSANTSRGNRGQGNFIGPINPEIRME